MEEELPLRRLMDKEQEEEENIHLHDEIQPLRSFIEEELISILRYDGLDSVACLH